MFDSHTYPKHWGIYPYAKVLGISVPMYSLMIFAGLVTAIILLKFLKKQSGPQTVENEFYDKGIFIVLAGLGFGILGAKLPIWIMNWNDIAMVPFSYEKLLAGRTVVGGFVGGLIGVMAMKKLIGIKGRHGNILAPSIALGMAFGRVGCFCRGCCYGIQTASRWGVDFGDHVLRHPTQLYEVTFHLAAFVILMGTKTYKKQGGRGLSLYFLSYLTYRFVTEFIRIHERVWLGMTRYQWACLLGIAFLLVKETIGFKRLFSIQEK